MFKTLRTLFQKVLRIQKAVNAVNTTLDDASTIAQQKDLTGVAGAIAQAARDADDATRSIQDAAK